MLKVKVYNQAGEPVGEEQLNPDVFDVVVKPALVQQAVVAQQANRRQVLAHTKDRSQVRGGGKKPWRQKGTGRARHGSSRSPIWRGGGVTFGPTKETNFSLKINKKVKRQAILMSLSQKAANQKIVLVDKLELPKIKTKDFFIILQNLKLRPKRVAKTKSQTKTNKDAKTSKVKKEKDKSVLVVMTKQDDKIFHSARNLASLMTISTDSLNVLDILKHQYLLLPVESLKKIQNLFLGTKN